MRRPPRRARKRSVLVALAALVLASPGCGLFPMGFRSHSSPRAAHRFPTKPPPLVLGEPDKGRVPYLQSFTNSVREGKREGLAEGEVFVEIHESRGGVGHTLLLVYDGVFLVPALLVALPPMLFWESGEIVVTVTDARGRVAQGRSEDSVFAVGTPLAPLLLIEAEDNLDPRPDLLLALKAALAELSASR